MPGFPRLEPGDRVAVVAPSSPIRPEMLSEGLAEVRRLGFVPVVRDDVGARHRFTAGDDPRRLEELAAALGDASIRAVWLARGGYGVTPLLRRLDPAAFLRDPKPVVGESDATALGCWALAHGVGWLHGPMVAGALRLGEAGYVESSLVAHLRGAPLPHREAPRAARALVAGEASGTLWGGCLSILSALAGTPWLPRVAEGVLFVEDVGVKPYQVHRMLVQLRDAGALEGLRGAVLGDFSACVQHPDQGYDLDDVFLDFFRDVAPRAPVVTGWPAGHAPAPHVALAMGAPVTLRADEGACSLEWTG